ncbi:hypothetical protein Tsubulata_000798 [Turnera subulata]|uniref:rRNA N-glycosylase n=1 Tax=Turnera subulata TaxID=218843 RepID=A0A9Q0JLC9_9ROSI|nr:hypothetical protein Tsubulata_000798 [Turnera subulata]
MAAPLAFNLVGVDETTWEGRYRSFIENFRQHFAVGTIHYELQLQGSLETLAREVPYLPLETPHRLEFAFMPIIVDGENPGDDACEVEAIVKRDDLYIIGFRNAHGTFVCKEEYKRLREERRAGGFSELPFHSDYGSLMKFGYNANRPMQWKIVRYGKKKFLKACRNLSQLVQVRHLGEARLARRMMMLTNMISEAARFKYMEILFSSPQQRNQPGWYAFVLRKEWAPLSIVLWILHLQGRYRYQHEIPAVVFEHVVGEAEPPANIRYPLDVMGAIGICNEQHAKAKELLEVLRVAGRRGGVCGRVLSEEVEAQREGYLGVLMALLLGRRQGVRDGYQQFFGSGQY